MHVPHKIIISRTDSIGDVLLTLPITGALKAKFPHSQLIFLGRTYTENIIRCCTHVDDFINMDAASNTEDLVKLLTRQQADCLIHVFPRKQIAKAAAQAQIKTRIGTSHRLYHWLNVNKKVNFSRKKSTLHEAQLNFSLLSPFHIAIPEDISGLAELSGFKNIYTLPETLKSKIQKGKYHLILHPKSKGSAREWPLEKYKCLIEMLPPEKVQIFITGTAEESLLLGDFLNGLPAHVTDMTGQMSLSEFIAFIDACDGLLAASTGPLHIASQLGKDAFGLYPPIQPMHPGRWAPIGQKAHVFVVDKACEDCRKTKICRCMEEINVRDVAGKIQQVIQNTHI